MLASVRYRLLIYETCPHDIERGASRQVRVVPDIVATERHSHVQSRDICVSAPTGSGKTLVFVLGVLQVRKHVPDIRHNHRFTHRTDHDLYIYVYMI